MPKRNDADENKNGKLLFLPVLIEHSGTLKCTNQYQTQNTYMIQNRFVLGDRAYTEYLCFIMTQKQ